MNGEDRIKIVQDKMGDLDLCCVLLCYSRDILYYAGTAQPSYLVILPDDYFLFVRSGIDFALNDVFINKEKVKEERRLANIFKEIFSGPEAGSKTIGTELDILTAEQFQEIKKTFPGYDFINISPVVLEQRKTKNASEIEKIRKSCDAIHRGHEAVLSTLKEGVTELELAAAVENAHRLAGHEGIFFIRQPDFFMSRGPISSGANLFRISGVVYTITGVGLSSSVPAGPSLRRISRGEPVIVDIPTLVEGYHADQTRTYCLGKASEEVKSMYNDLRTIADYLISHINPNMKCSEIYSSAIEKAKELGRLDQFQNFGKGKKSRLIGHGIGLELNEPPIPSEYDHTEVGEHYVIALDMHMMDEAAGVVKLEDMVLIGHRGNEILTKSPRDLFEI
ncbi:MAG: Xaa-Pro peptidase family protein [Syntrophales bacterium]|jgi:Xaa-Pro aminopeptidase|nr:Xaa-Pro peptidase family protein [Syntrophales bacterium]